MQTWVDLPFADGVYTFRLGLGQISEIERKQDAGLGRIFARTMAGRYGYGADEILPEQADYRFADLVEVIRQALIGGNHARVGDADVQVSSSRADELIRHYLTNASDGRMPVKRVWSLAASILGALIEGYSPPGEADAGQAPAS